MDELDTKYYEALLQEEFPEHTFKIDYYEPYKNGSTIYQVTINDGEDPEYTFHMLVGYLGITEDKQKENFKRVVQQKFEARERRLEKERKEGEKNKK